MNKNIVSMILKFIHDYLIPFVMPSIEVLRVTIKTEIENCKKRIIEFASEEQTQIYLKAKKDELVNKFIDELELPLLLKPFKGIIKKIVKSNIDNFMKKLV